MPKRFYKKAAHVPSGRGFAVELDGRVIKTPKRHDLILPTEQLALEIAREWEAVEGDFVMDRLPVTRLVYGALDKDEAEQSQAVAEMVRYGGSDLVCYRADDPESLILHQHEVWQPLLDWLKTDLGVTLRSTAGIMAVSQSDAALATLVVHLSERSSFELAGLQPAVALLGSCVIALALFHGRLSAREAAEASLLDELWQEQRWGADAEAEARRARIFSEIEAIERYFSALRD